MSLFISRLILNANHPQAKSEASHPYELHRTICKAFEKPDEARILFRADTNQPGEVHVIVQSLVPPDWNRLDTKGGYLREKDEPKQVELSALQASMTLRFRLRCRPSKRIRVTTREDKGKRRAVTEKKEIFDWLERKAKENGFEVKDVASDRIYWHDSKEGQDPKPLYAVQFDGILIVTDPEKLKEAVRSGIGPQKAYGFGLLSLAPVS